MSVESLQPIAGDFKGKDIVSIGQFQRTDVERLFHESEAMGQLAALQEDDSLVTRGNREFYAEGTQLLRGKRLATVFYEPSTRTASSFVAAMAALGGGVIPNNEIQYSSVSKGENLRDTVRTLERYAHVLVLRHPTVGSAALAAAAIEKPLINGGDGVGEHPTQALLDLFTINEEAGHVNDLSVTMLGDLKNGRTVHSLARLLGMYGGRLNYVSPESLRMPEYLRDELQQKGVEQVETELLDDVLADTDVLYVTRVQKERFEGEEGQRHYEQVKDLYVITPETMERANPDMVLMHPLPRVGEIDERVDADPRAAYFRQMEYGMHVRMALLSAVLGRSILELYDEAIFEEYNSLNERRGLEAKAIT